MLGMLGNEIFLVTSSNKSAVRIKASRQQKSPATFPHLIHSNTNTTAMAKFFAIVILAFAVTVVASDTLAGGFSDLTDEEKSNDRIVGFKNQGVDKIYQDKQAANSIPACLVLTGELVSGRKQVVAGLKYELTVNVSAVKSSTQECQGSNADPNTVPQKTCKITIWDKPGGQEQEITYEC